MSQTTYISSGMLQLIFLLFGVNLESISLVTFSSSSCFEMAYALKEIKSTGKNDKKLFPLR